MQGTLLGLLPRGGTLPSASWASRQRAVVAILWLHGAFIPLYALYRGFSLGHIVLEGLVVPAAALVASQEALPRRVRTMVASVGLLSSSAVLVHLSGGLIEMHFHFFVMVGRGLALPGLAPVPGRHRLCLRPPRR